MKDRECIREQPCTFGTELQFPREGIWDFPRARRARVRAHPTGKKSG